LLLKLFWQQKVLYFFVRKQDLKIIQFALYSFGLILLNLQLKELNCKINSEIVIYNKNKWTKILNIAQDENKRN